MDKAEIDRSMEALTLYKAQLAQIEAVLLSATDDQRSELEHLEKDLREIIELTESSLASHPNDAPETPPPSTLTEGTLVSDDLKSLEGTKCQAPFNLDWGGIGYYNAVILEGHLEEEEDSGECKIYVKVAFVNPVHHKMKPCPYYLEGNCRFPDDKCRFSHGHQVPLDSLKDFKETDYSLLQKGRSVICKHHEDGLWYPARIVDTLDDGRLSVQYQGYDELHTLEIHDVVLNEASEQTSEGSDDDTAEDFYPRALESWAAAPDDSSQGSLGTWQKHTRGIGSKLMLKMGYVEGQGLGKQGEGRLDPVEAVVFPPGRSLDRCMELRENADSSDLFKVEKRLERQKLKEERKLRQMAEAAEKQKKDSVFDFLNVRLAQGSSSSAGPNVSDVPSSSTLKEVSSKGLNVQSFQISEDIKKVEREIVKLKESIERQSGRGDHATATSIRGRLEAKEKELQRLKLSEKSISREQTQRKGSSKLTVF